MLNQLYWDFLKKLLRESSGTMIDEGKEYLVVGRLDPIRLEMKLPSIESLLEMAMNENDLSIRKQIINALLTHETFFFREPAAFDFVTKYSNENFVAKGKQHIRVWSAACSSGQEIFSLLMSFDKNKLLDNHKYRMDFVATDYSSDIIKKAKEGSFSAFDVSRGLWPLQLSQYFQKKGENYKLIDPLLSKVSFSEHNLLSPPPSNWGTFDVIFCRNVLIYFTKSDRDKILQYLTDSLSLGGMLVLGSSEIITSPPNGLRKIEKSPVLAFEKI